MSYVETHLGKLKQVDLQGKTEEQFFQEKCNDNSIIEIPSYSDSWKEAFFDKVSYEKYFSIQGEIWELIEHTELKEGQDIEIITPNEDGSVNFMMQFYNGGTCLSEVVEDSLSKYLKK